MSITDTTYIRHHIPKNHSLASRKRLVTRKKVLVVPYYISSDGKKLVVLVQDSKTKEWGFISGGVKANEDSHQAAKRELFEESSSTIRFSESVDYFQFVSLYRPIEMKTIDRKRNEIVRSIYTVFMFQVNDKDLQLMYHQFVPNKEVIDIKCGEYTRFEGTWAFCDDVFQKYVQERLH
jgi:8-oxo-dGTP pyrophosphatase MutT (NUDIX family)